MRVLVTGAAGFVGSHLCERLVGEGHEVVGIDALLDYYDLRLKERNLRLVRAVGGDFRFEHADINTVVLSELLSDIEVVFHLAGQPGVRASWGQEFDIYLQSNIAATQKLLEAARAVGVRRVVYASSSSVYGDRAAFPTREDLSPSPRSPYGVTKLAGEHLAVLYAQNYGLETISLRYHTVYGPRQRPDMATDRLIKCALTGDIFTIFGALDYIRDFTFVSDIVDATIRAGVSSEARGTVLNVAGGSSITMRALIELIEGATGNAINVEDRGPIAGDVKRTGGDISLAQRVLGWTPQVTLAEGIRVQLEQVRQDLDLLRV